MSNDAKIFNQFLRLAAECPDSIKREAGTVVHKMLHPMHKILAKVPGASLTERAKELHVSRQTYYVWMHEKFRPTKVQAKRISKITGVPVEHIVDDGFEVDNDAGKKARQKIARMAARREEAAKRDGGDEPQRRRKGDAGSGDVAA